jgi:unsaturated chondroitin disaccharide hydrolase
MPIPSNGGFMTGSLTSTISAAGAADAAISQLGESLALFGDAFPGDTTRDGLYALRAPGAGVAEGGNHGWTTGFWSGLLWLSYEQSGDERFRTVAQAHLASFARRLGDGVDCDTHDLGFLYLLSSVVPWRLTGDELARRTGLAAADRLMTRFIEPAGVFQAWGRLDDPQQRGRVIIDSLMNMPLLHWASRETGDQRYTEAAHRHVSRLRDHIIRPDGSTFHTFYFDPDTGAALHGDTAQGYADHSCWARGQAWGVLGFALNARASDDPTFLDAAGRLADYYLGHLPPDSVPFWDLSFDHASGQYRDSSAAAIVACGLFELDALAAGAAYRPAAERMLSALSSGYTPAQTRPGSPLLEHAVYSLPEGFGVDEGCLWGDYFYLEALVRSAAQEWRPYWWC